MLARTGQRVLRPAATTARTAPPEPSVEPSGDNVTDEYTLAARYLTLHGQDRRFIYGINRWMRWTEGTGWTEDPGERVTREIQCLGQQTFGSFVDGAWKRKPMPGGRWATAAGAQRSATVLQRRPFFAPGLAHRSSRSRMTGSSPSAAGSRCCDSRRRPTTRSSH